MNDKSSQKTIQSLEKGLILLECIEQSKNPLSLQDIWLELQWNKATIYRMLNTFQNRGYIQRDPAAKTYRLGMKILSLYNSFIRDFDIQQIIKPYLQTIVEKTNEEAHIAIVIDKSIVFIDRMKSPKMISTNSEIGLSMPLHATALGKAYLAYLDLDKITEKLDLPLQQFTPHTLTELEDLLAELREIKRRGFALDNGEYEEDMRCVAAPIFRTSNIPFAMIGISGLHTHLSQETCREFGELIKQLSLEISSKFSYGE